MPHKPQQPTRKHHYLPEFYLKRWASSNGKLFEFARRERIGVVSRPTAPGGTGWQKDLYKADGMPPEIAYAFEDQFFSPVDSLAADTLKLLEEHGGHYPFTINQRRAWSRFVMSLWTRLPQDVTALKKHWRETVLRIDPADEAEYAAARQEDDPASFSEYIAAQHLGYMDGTMFKALAEIIDGGRGSGDLATIDWTVLALPFGTTSLLTSDRPLLWSDKFGSLDGFMAMPIGPQRLFIAARDPGYIIRLRQNTTIEKLVREMNLTVVQAAKRFVYGHDETQAYFIRNRFGTKAGPSVVEQVIAKKLGASSSDR